MHAEAVHRLCRLHLLRGRPSDVLDLRRADCVLPANGWGRIDLATSDPRAGKAWTDDGRARQRRGLKRRGQAETRSVPIPLELVDLLRAHLEQFGTAEDGRHVRAGSGGEIQDSRYAAVWRRARAEALTTEEVASPLADGPTTSGTLPHRSGSTLGVA